MKSQTYLKTTEQQHWIRKSEEIGKKRDRDWSYDLIGIESSQGRKIPSTNASQHLLCKVKS